MSWEQYDRDLVLALRQVERDEERNRCPLCGLDKSVCQDPANQRAFEAHLDRCYPSRAVGWAMRARADDQDARALVATMTFHPDRVKH